MFDLASQTKIKGVVRFRPFPVATGREELEGRHSGKKSGGGGGRTWTCPLGLRKGFLR